MTHRLQNEPSPKEVADEAEGCLQFMSIFAALMKYGITLFEPDGHANGVGLEVLDLVLEHFEQRESYGRCAYIKKIKDEYQRRWPYRQANYSIN